MIFIAKINEFGEIIRNKNDSSNIDSTFPTFTPPKMELSHENKGDKILATGEYEYKRTKYDLSTLENLAQIKEQKLAQIKEKQFSLQQDGILLSSETLLRDPQKAQEYITELQGEMSKQKELDTQRKMKETKEFSSKMPNISLKPSYVDIDEK